MPILSGHGIGEEVKSPPFEAAQRGVIARGRGGRRAPPGAARWGNGGTKNGRGEVYLIDGINNNDYHLD